LQNFLDLVTCEIEKKVLQKFCNYLSCNYVWNGNKSFSRWKV